MPAPLKFPSSLAWWRKKRGFSQLQLAMAAACSQRHVSFLELGRAKPSRDMVLRLSAALDLPLRQSNELLLGAGFAPVWTQTSLQAAPLAPVREALGYILDQQEPYPAVVVDRQWNLLQANKGATALVAFLVGPITPGAAINLADALVAPDVLRPYLLNWDDVVRYFIRSVGADAAADATSETADLLERLLRYKDVKAAIARDAPAADGPILPMHFRKGRTELRLFTTIATLGTPQDVTLQELRIESFFPMDEATRNAFHMWAKQAGGADKTAANTALATNGPGMTDAQPRRAAPR
jgi:transcriptional regulator with XRE-family HTH domain